MRTAFGREVVQGPSTTHIGRPAHAPGNQRSRVFYARTLLSDAPRSRVTQLTCHRQSRGCGCECTASKIGRTDKHPNIPPTTT
jgi:hypothetical protein